MTAPSVKHVEVYLTPAELLSRWKKQVAPTTLKNWRSRGGGPAFTKLGGRVVYAVRDVEEYEKKNRRT